MHVDPDPRVVALIQQKVETGRYTTAADVVRDAMRLLEEWDQRRQTLHTALAVGFDELDRGRRRVDS